MSFIHDFARMFASDFTMVFIYLQQKDVPLVYCGNSQNETTVTYFMIFQIKSVRTVNNRMR